jgi:hypothetical protein
MLAKENNTTMKLLRRSLPVLGMAIVMACSVAIRAQTHRQVEPNYEIVLQFLIGSNDAAQQGEIPNDLNNIARQVKSRFRFSNFRLAGTFLGRVADSGNFEYKSTTNILGQESTRAHPTFLEWQVTQLRSGTTPKGPQGFEASSFRFGAKVPVVTNSIKDDKPFPVVQYESIGLSVARVGVPENVPALIGTVNLPGTGGTIFVVMTVRSADL